MGRGGARRRSWGAEKVVGRRGVGVGCQCARGERRVGWRGTRPWERARAPAKAAGEGSRPHRGGVGLSVRGKEAFLVVAAAVAVDEGYEMVEAGVVRGEGEQALQ